MSSVVTHGSRASASQLVILAAMALSAFGHPTPPVADGHKCGKGTAWLLGTQIRIINQSRASLRVTADLGRSNYTLAPGQWFEAASDEGGACRPLNSTSQTQLQAYDLPSATYHEGAVGTSLNISYTTSNNNHNLLNNNFFSGVDSVSAAVNFLDYTNDNNYRAPPFNFATATGTSAEQPVDPQPAFAYGTAMIWKPLEGECVDLTLFGKSADSAYVLVHACEHRKSSNASLDNKYTVMYVEIRDVTAEPSPIYSSNYTFTKPSKAL